VLFTLKSKSSRGTLLLGLLWSAGNASSILAIQHLGLAVGWPLVQCQLIVSTVWGIVYYKEVTGAAAVGVFVTSALVVLAGVVVLGTHGM
jgi:glucose uptake protein GlcU